MVQEVDPEFRSWLEKAYPRLTLAVHRLVGKVELEEDILHDVIVHLIAKEREITSPEMLVAYGIRLARWRALDAYRKHAREDAVAARGDLESLLYGRSDASSEATLLARDELLHQLERLSPRVRKIIILSLAGQESDQIAKTLGIAPATVRSLLRHARYQLAAADTDHEQP